jgi:hypothetical protein
MKKLSISLATSRIISGVGRLPLDGRFSIQMLSADLSGPTIFNLQLSLDGTNWDNAVANDTDISDTLVVNETKIKAFECAGEAYWHILFAGVTTGTVNCLIHQV